MKQKNVFLILILLTILAGFFSYRVKIKNLWFDLTKEKLPEPIEYQDVDESKTEDIRHKTEDRISNSTNAPRRVPTDSLNLDVPFTPQAPLADWNETFKEACEEASALMVHYYYKNKTFTPEIATEEILKMVDWQLNYFGGHFDLTAEETAEMIRNYFGYQKVEVLENPTIDDIKNHLNQKRPVIVPAAGRLLGNPYFRNPGPIYHMLVIKGYIQHHFEGQSGAGYTEDKFITNDPGTKRGEDYLYDYETLMAAMHDWNKEDVTKGEKRIIVIYPN